MGRRLLLLVTLTGCSYSMGYAAPARWQHIRLGAMPNVSAPLQEAARYQIETCENIADAYGARARSTNVNGRWMNVIAPVVTAVGAALSGFAPFANGNTETAMQASGITLTLLGAGWTATNVVVGSGRTDAYSGASDSLRTAVDGFREFVEDDSRTDARLAPRLCSLRARCYRAQVGTTPVGTAFSVTGVGVDQTMVQRRHLLQGLIAAVCSSDAAVQAQCELALANPAASPAAVQSCIAGAPLHQGSTPARSNPRDPTPPQLNAQ